MALLTFLATVAAMWALLCRLNAMDKGTPRLVRNQHVALFAGLVMSLVLPSEWAHLALLAGVLAFLAASAHRWRFGSPLAAPFAGTSPLPEIDDRMLGMVSGGQQRGPTQ